jgi:uncharacterized membrane protein
MLAACPPLGAPDVEEVAQSIADMNIAAAGQYTHGLRAFFLAIAVLAWFVNPWVFAGATVVIVIALANRQFNSKARYVAVAASKRLTGKA